MPFLARAGLTVVWFFATLIFEVLLAMAIYVYIRLNHRGFFDRLTDFSFDVLNVVRDILRSSTPGLAERANVALVSDLSAGAMLLLMLGCNFCMAAHDNRYNYFYRFPQYKSFHQWHFSTSLGSPLAELKRVLLRELLCTLMGWTGR